MSGREEWQNLENLENEYIESAKEKLLEHQECCGFSFIGFAYRGIAVHGGRSHAFHIGSEVEGYLLEAGCESPFQAVRRGISLYLLAYGKPTTFNNLTLETIWRAEASSPPTSIHLALGSDVSEVGHEEGRLNVRISHQLLGHLQGEEESQWRDLFLRLANVDGKDNLTHEGLLPFVGFLRSMRETVESSVYFSLFEESSFTLQAIKTLLPGWEDGRGKGDPLTGLRQWFGAFQGLLILSHALGRDWISVPVEPAFGRHLPEHLKLPKSALTVVFSDRDNVSIDHLSQICESLRDCALAEGRAKSAYSLDAAVASRQKERMTKIFADWNSSLAEDLVRRFPGLPDLLKLAYALQSAEHEGKRLSFTLLCAPDSHLLRLHWRGFGWAIAEVQVFSSADIQQARGPQDRVRVGDVADDIRNNAFLLQGAGRALHFRPDTALPSAVVEFRPFVPGEASRYLREFTEAATVVGASDDALAITVNHREAQLFASGKLAAILRDKRWQPAREDLFGSSGPDPLVEAIKQTDWWPMDANEHLERCILGVCNAAVAVAERRYGALFFLVNRIKGRAPVRTVMAPVWARDRFVEHDEAEYVASFAGLDGETYVDVESGRYFTRQFTLVPNEDFLRLFEDTGAHTAEFDAYLNAYVEYLGERSGDEQEPVSDDGLRRLSRKVEQFGTRHLKALRVTRAFPSSTIAITCSSSGPVRLWHKGFVAREF